MDKETKKTKINRKNCFFYLLNRIIIIRKRLTEAKTPTVLFAPVAFGLPPTPPLLRAFSIGTVSQNQKRNYKPMN